MLTHSFSITQKTMHRKSFVILVALSFQNTASVLLMKFTLRKDARPYDAATAVAITEFIKLGVCILIVMLQRSTDIPLGSSLSMGVHRKFGVPAILYAAQNNLVYVAAESLTVTSYVVCSQGKIFATAFFSVLVLSTKLNARHYISLILLACGMVLTQLDVDTVVGSTYPSQHEFRGIVAITLASVSSGFAGVYLEVLYKTDSESIWTKNVQLGAYAFPATCMFAIASQFRNWNGKALSGFDSAVCVLLLLQAMGGLIIAGVMKYASSILKCFAVSISICLCALISALCGDETSMLQLFGVLLVILSTILYSIQLHHDEI